MTLRGLDPKMIANLHDIVEKKFFEMSTQLDASLADQGKKVIAKFEASLVDRVKDEVRKEFRSYLWGWSLPIRKRVVWPVKRLVRERRWHSKVDVGFVDQFVESDTEPAEQLEVVAEYIPNLVDVGMDIGFHDQLVEHLVVDDPIVVGGELCATEHLVVSNEIAGVASLACVDGDLHVVANVELGFFGMDSLVIDVDEDLLMKHNVQFVLGSEHADWMIEILVFDSIMQMWMTCMFVFLSLLEWKPLVKMKMVFYLSLGIKVWDTLFYLLGDSDAGVS